MLSHPTADVVTAAVGGGDGDGSGGSGAAGGGGAGAVRQLWLISPHL